MTAYAIALLADRRLLIKITHPCNLEEYIQPNEIDWSTRFVDIGRLSRYDLLIDVNLTYIQHDFVKINFLNYKKTTNLIRVRTGANLIKHLTLNKNHHTKIMQLGYKLDEFNLEHLFYRWYKKLFKFNAGLTAKYSQMITMTSGSKLICGQIRIGGTGDIMKFASRRSSKEFWRFLEKRLIKTKDYKLFITTDKHDVLGEALKKFGKKHVIGFKERSFHLARVKQTDLLDIKCNKISELYLDFMFLGRCQSGIISHSGFGMLGILNRKNFKETIDSNFYIFTNPNDIMSDFANRKNLTFMKFNTKLLYLEFPYLI